MFKKVAVTGVSGAQGGAVARKLLSEGYSVRGIIRGGESFSLESVEIAQGDYSNPESLLAAFQGVDAVCVSYPLVFDRDIMLNYARNTIWAIRESGVQKMVFNTNLPILPTKTGIIAFDIKAEIEALFDDAQLPYVSLRPTVYLENLVAPWSLPAIVHSSILPYPLPLHKPLSWSSHITLAACTVAALANENVNGKKIDVGGKDLYTLTQVAQAISEVLGRKIQSIHVSPDDFQAKLALAMPEEAALEVANIYRLFNSDSLGEEAITGDEDAYSLLNVPELSLLDWARSVDWQA